MSKEQIEQIDTILREIFGCQFAYKINLKNTFTRGLGYKEIQTKDIAEALYNAGYRKQKEGEWIDRYNGDFANPIYACSVCEKGTLLKPYIDELGNMKMTQALSPFCPNCGAHMKGCESDA